CSLSLFFFSSRRRHTRWPRDWSSDVCSSDLLLTGGSRTALPRRQTLRAAIDWSYHLLGGAEGVLFRRLSLFPGSFSLEVAESIRSEERRVGKVCRCRVWSVHVRKK